MNNGRNVNDKIWKIILEQLVNLREWSEYSGISKATLSGWKNNNHLPREDSLKFLLNAISEKLQADKKKLLFDEIVNSLKIEVASEEYKLLAEQSEENYNLFLYNALNQNYFYDLSGKILEKHILNELIKQKFDKWFVRSNNQINVDFEIIKERSTFIISIKECNKNIPPVIFSYAINPKIRIMVTKLLLDDSELTKEQPISFDSLGFPTTFTDF